MSRILSQMIQVHIAVSGVTPGDWQFLLLKRSANEYVYPGLWQIVTGDMDEGETAVEAARREVWEETGIQCNKLWTLPFVGNFFDAENDVVHLVPAFGCIASSVDIQLSSEHEEFGWFSYQEALHRLIIPSYIQGMEVFHHSILSSPETAVFPISHLSS